MADASLRGAEEIPRSRPIPSTRVAETIVEELWFGDDDPNTSRAEAERSFAAGIAKLQGLRPFPVAAQRLMTELSHPNFRVSEVVGVMETDPALAARTLAVANCPIFRSAVPCKTISQALLRLGARNVRDVAIGVAAMSMFADTVGSAARRLRDHSVGVAAIARCLAEVALPIESSAVFLAGLMHDVGMLLLLQTGEYDYGDVTDLGDTHVAERLRLGYDHAVLGGHVMKLWRIPDPTAKVVAWHHQHTRAYNEGGEVGAMVALLSAADHIDELFATDAALDPAEANRIGQSAAWTYLDLSTGDLREHWSQFASVREEMLAALGSA